MNIIQSWLNEPTFSLKIFVIGLVPFFLGVIISFLGQWGIWEQTFLSWGLMALGIFIAIPGYIGIWRWRWIKFKND